MNTNNLNSDKIIIRTWLEEDIPKIVACHRAVYPDYPEDGGHYEQRHYELQFHAFPVGQFLAEKGDQVVGYATSIIVQLSGVPDDYRYSEITGDGTFSTHSPDGDTLYGADIGVHPEFRGQNISKMLYKARKKLLKKYNLRRMIAYGRIPGYKDYVGQYSPEEYVNKIIAGELRDPALNAHLTSNYTVKKVLLDYVWDDSSMNFCTFLEYENPSFKPHRRRVAAAPLKRMARKVRVSTAQYLLRDIKSWEEFKKTTEFFVDAADSYGAQFLLLPEMFTAQMLNFIGSGRSDRPEILKLTEYTAAYQELFATFAKKYGFYIIAGSHPVLREDKIINVAHCFSPSGNCYTQDKLHPTPSEKASWDMKPGSGLKIFETPHFRFGIQICYDIEFPEASRLLAKAGAEVIFVPYSTDDRKGHNRVSYCARARAIENSVYVVTSGNAGTIANRGYLLNYAESAVYTPSDYGFPPQGEAGRADPNIETVVIADLDLDALAINRESGSTRPLADRRTDLFDVISRVPIQKVIVV